MPSGKGGEVVHLLRVSRGSSGLSWVSLWEEQRGDSNSAGVSKALPVGKGGRGCLRERAIVV